MRRIQGLGLCAMTFALSACATDAGSGTADAGSGAGGTPMGGTPVGGTPVGGMPMGGTPVGGVPSPDAAPSGGVASPDAAPTGGLPSPDAAPTGGVPFPDAAPAGGVPSPDAFVAPDPDAGVGGAIEPPPGPCATPNDGRCDEPEGTDTCPEGTDFVDCEVPAAPVQTCEAACGRIVDCSEASGLCAALPPGGAAQVEALCLDQCAVVGDILVGIVNGQALCGGLLATVAGLNAEFCVACHGAGAPECGGQPPPPPVDCDAACGRVVGCMTDGVTCEALGPNDAAGLSATCAQACGQFGQLFADLVSQSPNCGALATSLGQLDPSVCTLCHGPDAPACAPPPPPPPPPPLDESCAAACTRLFDCTADPALCPAADPAQLAAQTADCNVQCVQTGGVIAAVVNGAADCASLIDLAASASPGFRAYCSGP
jgi:hypothetical protein